MRGIMHRAVEQARAEAAAQAQGAFQAAPAGDAASADAAEVQEGLTQDGQQQTAESDGKASPALLGKAAQMVQQHDSAAALTTTPLQRSVTIQQVSAARNSEDQPDDAADDLLDLAAVNLTGLSEETSDSSNTGLLPTEPQLRKSPTKGLSLGEKLGSILRNALSIPRQGIYAPISGDENNVEDVDDDGVDGAEGDAPWISSTQRVLPRDASYLPEWLTRTLKRGSTLGKSFTSRSSGSFSRGSGVSRAGSALPEWVDVDSLQHSSLPESSSDKADQPRAASHKALQQQQHVPELFTKALKPVSRPAPTQDPPVSLITAPSWPPTDAEAPAAASKESRGKRLLAFWQQQQPTATAAESFGQKPAMHQTPAHAVHARSRAMQQPGLQLDNKGQARTLSAQDGMLLSLGHHTTLAPVLHTFSCSSTIHMSTKRLSASFLSATLLLGVAIRSGIHRQAALCMHMLSCIHKQERGAGAMAEHADMPPCCIIAAPQGMVTHLTDPYRALTHPKATVLHMHISQNRTAS